MLNVLKRSGGKATDSSNRMFTKTRLALTLVYVIILAGILASSSGISRYIFTERLRTRFEGSERPNEAAGMRPPATPPDMRNIQTDFQETILLVNGLLLIFAALLSYWLAGITLRPIRASYDRQRQFLSDASHELRTPLAILQTSLENQRAKVKGSEDKVKIDSHLEEVARMSHLVDDLLKLSSGNEGGGNKIQKSDIDVVGLVQVTMDRLQSLADSYNVTMTLKKTSDKKLTILADEVSISQALANILKNAVLYNKPDGRVLVHIAREKSRAIIKIEDTGIGMSDEDQKHAFDRFYRADKSRSRQTGGSGLGLSIAQSIIQAHHGTIQIASKPAEGTTVTISLPLSDVA